jgi:hypothetical protein
MTQRRGLTLACFVVALTLAAGSAQAQTYKPIYNFTDFQDGANPDAGVTMDGAGNLYGTTVTGSLGDGTAYRLHRVLKNSLCLAQGNAVRSRTCEEMISSRMGFSAT